MHEAFSKILLFSSLPFPSHRYEIFSKTLLGVMVMSGSIPGAGSMSDVPAAKRRIDAACHLLATGFSARAAAYRSESFEEQHAWQLAHESPVPTLCLTSSADHVVPESAVRTYADALRGAHAHRDVRVVSLRGSHCQVHMYMCKCIGACIGTGGLPPREPLPGTYVHMQMYRCMYRWSPSAGATARCKHIRTCACTCMCMCNVHVHAHAHVHVHMVHVHVVQVHAHAYAYPRTQLHACTCTCP